MTDGRTGDDKPQMSPDGNTVYFTSDRDGYLCIWSQRLTPVTKHPVGPPAAFEHFHNSMGRDAAIENVQLPENDASKFVELYGGAAYCEQLNNAKPLIETLSDQARASFDVKGPTGRLDAMRSIIDVLARTPSEKREAMASDLGEFLRLPQQEHGHDSGHVPQSEQSIEHELGI